MGPPPCHENSILFLLFPSLQILVFNMSDEVVIIDPDATDNNNTQEEENGVAADVTRETVIGEPDSSDFRLHGSVVYTHNYFKKIDRNTQCCLSCKAFNEANPTKPPRKDNFKVSGGNTSGKNQKSFFS